MKENCKRKLQKKDKHEEDRTIMSNSIDNNVTSSKDVVKETNKKLDKDIDYNLDNTMSIGNIENLTNIKSHAEENAMDTGFYIAGWVCIGLIALYVFITRVTRMQLITMLPPCAFHQLTGLYCPGCGGTRAAFAFARGHIVRSFLLHPIVPYVGILGGYFMLSQTISRVAKKDFRLTMHFRYRYLWLALGIVIGNFIIRNLVFIIWKYTIL